MTMVRSRLLTALLIGCLTAWLVARGVLWSYRDKPNYSIILDNLSMGGSGAEPPPGTQAVLNLCEAQDPYTCEVHVWHAIPDAEPAPSLDWLRHQVEWIDAQLGAGRKTYVHCSHGVSRSGLVVTAYLMFKNNWTRDRALDFIRSRRESVRPNPAFMKRLLEWEFATNRRA